MDTTQQQIVILTHDELVVGDIVKGSSPEWNNFDWYQVREKHETYVRIGVPKDLDHKFGTHYTNHPRSPSDFNEFHVEQWKVRREVVPYTPSQIGDRDDDV